MKANHHSSSASISRQQLIRLQAVQFYKRKSNWLVLFVFLCAGLYGLYQGFADKRAKMATIAAFRQQSDSLLKAMQAGIVADTSIKEGKAAYTKSSGFNSGLWNTKVASYKTPVSAAIYNVGQGDVFTYYYLFGAENFEMQWLKQTEIANPLRSLAGHFDVSFWVIYLLPLMILLFSFHALSAERDNGNWRLIAAQGITEKRWLQSKLAVVGLCVVLLLLLVAAAGTVVNLTVFKQGVAWSESLFFLSSAAYLFFWLSLFYFVNSLRQPTAYNALVSGVAWIGLCLVVPVVISKLAETFIPIDNTLISTFSRRPQNAKIEADKAFAANFIKQLAKQEPGYANANADTSSPALYLRTYHAWHLLLHKQRWPVVQNYFQQVERRQRLTNWTAFINPAGSTDGYLTALADNDAAAFHHFTEETEALHNGLHTAFLESLFMKPNFSKSDYDAVPQFQYRRNALPYSMVAFYGFLFTLSFVLFFWANRILGNETLYHGVKNLVLTTWKTNSM